ncbi:FAD-dependent oxidoreductase [Ferrovibrio sp. MS7]|uniref:FAD-dependent oxidoreductase n=1 Tax=Ferrovibrio plantarum TaxID=3119164 RepID=UPI0031361BB5
MNAFTTMENRLDPASLPVAVIGAGPVGLAAAAHLIARGLPVRVYEAGAEVASHIRSWGHVRLFSPWSYNIDKAACTLLEQAGWRAPPANRHPTGAELVADYVQPLAELPQFKPAIETDARIAAVSRLGYDKMKTPGREAAPFVLVMRKGDGGERQDLARAVIDCSGTWSRPNPMGAHGLAVPGEADISDRIAYGIPDVLGADHAAYASARTLVVGAGHSAANVLLDLGRLAQQGLGTEILWAVRGNSLARLFGGGENDKLAERGALGRSLEAMTQAGDLDLHLGAGITAIRRDASALTVTLGSQQGSRVDVTVDRIVVAAGQRPDLEMLREIRLDLDPATESPRALAPLIDPNVHSCGTVRPHGHRELTQPDPGFYIAGIKSYGRAPTFLLATGYEQVRSIAAALAGDFTAADDVQLDLPETGVCSSNLPVEGAENCAAPVEAVSGGCCGPAKPRIRVKAASGCG